MLADYVYDDINCFFFQAEDGIRDYKVTGVQTCALPISTVSTRTQLPRRVRPIRIAARSRDLRTLYPFRSDRSRPDGAIRGVSRVLPLFQLEIGRASCRERV